MDELRPAECAVDSLSQPVLETPQPPVVAARPTGATDRLKPRNRFSVLVVRGDGGKVLRFSVPRRLPKVLLTAFGVTALAIGLLAADWWYVRNRLRESATLFQRVAEQQVLIDSFNRRTAELRREVTGWRDLHARIWEPFGPEIALKAKNQGVGGGRATAPERPMVLAPLSEELDRLVESVREEGENLRALDRLIARAAKALAALPSRWPARGAVNSEFGRRPSPWGGPREFHGGIDISADLGTTVRAPAAGRIYFAGRQADFGNMVIVDHGQDLRTIYGHLSKIHVRTGHEVERGTVLGLTGNTGRSTGPHLHYEILVKGQSVNPRAYLWD